MKAMRIKRFLCGALAFGMLLAAAGCAQRPQEPPHGAGGPSQEEEPGGTECGLEIAVGGLVFPATLADTAAAQAFAQKLPLTLSMRELNGNEKYCYLEEALPAASVQPERIRCGDLMLFGSSCVVLFYEDFSTSYAYTPLGAVSDPVGLAEALGAGGVTVTFRIRTA